MGVRVVYNGAIYEDCGWCDGRSDFRGHGGRMFKYHLKEDNSVAITNDLWYVGNVGEVSNIIDTSQDNVYYLKEITKLEEF